MPSTVRLDASITGPALDALRAGATESRIPQWQAGQGVNAYAPSGPRPPFRGRFLLPQLGRIAMALVAVVAVVALGVVAVRVLRAPAPAAPPVAVQPQLAAPTAAVVRETVVVVITATPMPAPVPATAVQVAPPVVVVAPRPVVRSQPQPVPVLAAPPAPVRRQTYVAPSYSTRDEPAAYQGVGSNAAVGIYQCAEQGVGVTEMDRATNGVKMDGTNMYLSNGDGDWRTPPTYRRLTNCRPK